MKKLFQPLIIGLITCWIPPAMAYIDPGSGSAIMSAIIGLFVAVGLAVKTYWYKLKSFFIGNLDKEATKKSNSTEEK